MIKNHHDTSVSADFKSQIRNATMPDHMKRVIKMVFFYFNSAFVSDSSRGYDVSHV